MFCHGATGQKLENKNMKTGESLIEVAILGILRICTEEAWLLIGRDR